MTLISGELQYELTERARVHYPNVLPYHNWDHAKDVMASAKTIASRSVHPEIRKNGPLLVIAAAWHDADYFKADTPAFETKEKRSADLAFNSLPELNRKERLLIASAIDDTTVAKTEKDSVFGEALHLADLGYFAADHPTFINRLSRMRLEWGNPSWDETVERTKAFGGHVILEAQKVLREIYIEKDADAWIAAINKNLASLEETTS